MKAASVGLCTMPCGVTLNWLRVRAMAVAYLRRADERPSTWEYCAMFLMRARRRCRATAPRSSDSASLRSESGGIATVRTRLNAWAIERDRSREAVLQR